MTASATTFLTKPRATMTLGGIVVMVATGIGALLRVHALDWMPLDPREAAIALAALGQSRGVPHGSIVAPPFVHHAAALALWLLGGGDAEARAVEAVAGMAVILAAWSMRSWLGRSAAVFAAVIVAVAPLWLFLSRSAGAGSLAALALAAALVAWTRPSRRAGLVVAGAFGLAWSAGGPGIAFLIAAAIAAGVAVVRGGVSAVLRQIAGRWPSMGERRDAALCFAAAAVLGATGPLLRIDGLAALVQVPTGWLQGLRLAGGLAWSGFLLPLLAYAPLLLAFGLVGVGVCARHPSALARFVGLWLAVGLLLGLIAGTPALVRELLLPLTLSAALSLARLTESVATRARWTEEGVMATIVLIVVAFGFGHLAAFAAGSDPTGGLAPGTIAVGAFGLVVLLLLIFGLLWSPAVAARVAGVSAVVVLPVVAWSNGSSLNYGVSNLLREPMRPRFVAPQAREVEAVVAAASRATAIDPHGYDVAADPAFERSLAWTLRDHQVRWVEVAGAPSESVAIVPSGAGAVPGTSVFRGRPVVVAGEWEPSFGGWRGFVRWWLQRLPADGASEPELQRANLYVTVE